VLRAGSSHRPCLGTGTGGSRCWNGEQRVPLLERGAEGPAAVAGRHKPMGQWVQHGLGELI